MVYDSATIAMMEDRVANGLPSPALENRPKLSGHLFFYYESFNELASRRQYGMGANPIMVSEIESYIRIFPWHDPELFYKYVSRLDNAYLKERNRQDELKSKSSK